MSVHVESLISSTVRKGLGSLALILLATGCGGSRDVTGSQVHNLPDANVREEGAASPDSTEGPMRAMSASSIQWNYFRTSSGRACVYGSFSDTSANQISVNIAEYRTWAGTYSRIQGSGYQPSSGARTGRVCAYACLTGPSANYYYKTDLWDLGGRKKYMDWITGNGIPDPQKYSPSWPIYTGTGPSGCTLSPPIPN